jgi:hypothetical protein
VIFDDVVDYCRAEAIASKLFPTLESSWRAFCRQYSKTFHTPLHDVMDLDPEFVMLAVFEEGYSSKNMANRDDAAYIIEEFRRMEDPNYDATQAQEFEDFAEGIEEWEDFRQSVKSPIPKKGQQVEASKPEEPKETPKQGFIDLSYLEDSDDEK